MLTTLQWPYSITLPGPPAAMHSKPLRWTSRCGSICLSVEAKSTCLHTHIFFERRKSVHMRGLYTTSARNLIQPRLLIHLSGLLYAAGSRGVITQSPNKERSLYGCVYEALKSMVVQPPTQTQNNHTKRWHTVHLSVLILSYSTRKIFKKM